METFYKLIFMVHSRAGLNGVSVVHIDTPKDTWSPKSCNNK